MFWTQLKVLLPGFFIHWAFTIILFVGAWFFFTKIYHYFKFNSEAPALVATVFSWFISINQAYGLYQNHMLTTAQYPQQKTEQASTAPAQNQPTIAEAKVEFLKNVEVLAMNPDKFTPEIKKKLFEVYAPLFTNGNKDKAEYSKQIQNIFACQKYFYEDALKSMQTKAEVKSSKRKDCETMAGSFFSRDKLLPQDLVLSNDATVAALSRSNRVPAADGKYTEVTEEMLKKQMSSFDTAVKTVKKIFE